MRLSRTKSDQLFTEAQAYIPGGVNSPVRAFRAVGGGPLFIRSGKGSKLIDADGNEYIDYVCSWGPLILGHAHPEVVRAVCEAAQEGTSFGAPTERETDLARLICEAMDTVEQVRLVNSGTEATMSAIRLARGVTGRTKIVKFNGCYHGHVDSLLVKAGSGATTLGIPDSAGVTPAIAGDTVSLEYNELGAVEEVFEREGDTVAAVIVEPVAGNMGVVAPVPGFLEGLRKLTGESGALLIFDEVITGFRVAYGGAQARYGVQPDLATLGKIIGGGLPVGAYGGPRHIMQMIAPTGPVYQAGTLSGNPLAVSAGLATVRLLQENGVYERLEKMGRALEEGLRDAARDAGMSAFFTRVGSMFCTFFTGEAVRDYGSALTASVETYRQFFQGMLQRGVYLPPSQFETCFVSLAHTEEDIERTLAAARDTFKTLAD
jgi:glutamate-1-semialdehyde 2,1-aminomutase